MKKVILLTLTLIWIPVVNAASIQNGGMNDLSGWDFFGDNTSINVLSDYGGITPNEGAGFLSITAPDFGAMPNGITQNIGSIQAGESIWFEYTSIGSIPITSGNFFIASSNSIPFIITDLVNQIIPEGDGGWSLFEFEAPIDITDVSVSFSSIGSPIPGTNGMLLVDNMGVGFHQASVPEPPALAMMIAGIAGIMAMRKKRGLKQT